MIGACDWLTRVWVRKRYLKSCSAVLVCQVWKKRPRATATDLFHSKAIREKQVMGISIWQLLIILAIVLVLFGAKRLRNVGGDLGGAIKGFRQAMKEEGDTSKNGDGQFSDRCGCGPVRNPR